MEAMILGYQYKNTWLNPVIKEELSCKWEVGNAQDTHALAVHNIIDEDIKTFGRIPRRQLCTVRFLLDKVAISIVKENHRCSSDLPQYR